MGLTTCYGIVKQHGGHIWCYSEVGRGTTFKIYLPRAYEQRHQRVQVDRGALPGGCETILLVEDDTAVRALAARVLRENGYTVLESPDGEAALALLRDMGDTPLDLLLTDVIMPKVIGPVLASQVLERRPNVRVLYMSGYTDTALKQHSHLVSNTMLLHKPFTPSVLVRKIREVLDRPYTKQTLRPLVE